MTGAHPATLTEDELLRDCELRFQRRSGPGGQHRNKVETAVRLRHRPTGVEAEASERRSQADNRRVALRRLRERLAIEVRHKFDEPSALWRSRCRNRRLPVNVDHTDYPALLAEALDVLHACEFAFPDAAALLGISNTQLANLLKKSPAAWQHVNLERARRQLPRLR